MGQVVLKCPLQGIVVADAVHCALQDRRSMQLPGLATPRHHRASRCFFWQTFAAAYVCGTGTIDVVRRP